MSENEITKMLENDKEYIEANRSIIELEKKLIKIAPDNVKEIYLEIDFFCCRQKEIEKNLLIKYL
jgi:hypothetical protein